MFYVVVFEGFRYKRALLKSLTELHKNPKKAFEDLSAAFSSRRQVVLLDREVTKALIALHQKVKNFILQVSDFVQVELLGKKESFRVLKRTLNFAPHKLQLARLKHDTFLDYYLSESHLECHRSHLRLDDHYVKVLTLKEPSSPELSAHLQAPSRSAGQLPHRHGVEEEDLASTEGDPVKRRHFHNTKRSLASHLNVSDAPPTDVLVDDSKEAQVRELGASIKELEIEGNYFGHFSLSVVIYDLDSAKVETAVPTSTSFSAFTTHSSMRKTDNLLNAFWRPYQAARPPIFVECTAKPNFTDFPFLFTLHCGEPENQHLKQDLAVLETNHNTPYFLNLHHRDVAHTMILGRTGSGKSFLLNFIITNMQKYEPYTFIFDLGGSFESLTRLFGGSYSRVGLNSPGFKINPFSVPPTKRTSTSSPCLSKFSSRERRPCN